MTVEIALKVSIDSLPPVRDVRGSEIGVKYC